MKRRIWLDNKYELIDGNWISRETIQEGTIRMIESRLHCAEPTELDEYDACTQRKGVVCTRWKKIDLVHYPAQSKYLKKDAPDVPESTDNNK